MNTFGFNVNLRHSKECHLATVRGATRPIVVGGLLFPKDAQHKMMSWCHDSSKTFYDKCRAESLICHGEFLWNFTMSPERLFSVRFTAYVADVDYEGDESMLTSKEVIQKMKGAMGEPFPEIKGLIKVEGEESR